MSASTPCGFWPWLKALSHSPKGCILRSNRTPALVDLVGSGRGMRFLFRLVTAGGSTIPTGCITFTTAFLERWVMPAPLGSGAGVFLYSCTLQIRRLVGLGVESLSTFLQPGSAQRFRPDGDALGPFPQTPGRAPSRWVRSGIGLLGDKCPTVGQAVVEIVTSRGEPSHCFLFAPASGYHGCAHTVGFKGCWPQRQAIQSLRASPRILVAPALTRTLRPRESTCSMPSPTR